MQLDDSQAGLILGDSTMHFLPWEASDGSGSGRMGLNLSMNRTSWVLSSSLRYLESRRFSEMDAAAALSVFAKSDLSSVFAARAAGALNRFMSLSCEFFYCDFPYQLLAF